MPGLEAPTDCSYNLHHIDTEHLGEQRDRPPAGLPISILQFRLLLINHQARTYVVLRAKSIAAMIRFKQPLVLSAQNSPFFTAAAAASSPQRRASSAGGRPTARRICCASTEEAIGVSTSVTTKERQLAVTAIVTTQVPTSVYVSRALDDLQDLLGKTLLLELVSSELDPSEFLSLVCVAGEL